MTNNREYLNRLYYEYFRAKENIEGMNKKDSDFPSESEYETYQKIKYEANQHEIIISNLLTDFLTLNNFNSF